MKKDATFFGVKAEGRSFAFVVDTSGLRVHHLRRRDHAELARVELPRLAQDLPQDVVADAARGLHLAAPLAGGAGLDLAVLRAAALARRAGGIDAALEHRVVAFGAVGARRGRHAKIVGEDAAVELQALAQHRLELKP